MLFLHANVLTCFSDFWRSLNYFWICWEVTLCALCLLYLLVIKRLAMWKEKLCCVSLSISLSCVNTSGLNVYSLSQGLSASHFCFVDNRHFSLTHSSIKCSAESGCKGENVFIKYLYIFCNHFCLTTSCNVESNLNFLSSGWLLSTHCTIFFIVYIYGYHSAVKLI